jgi:glycosyltransferase involved in cell wall biosynthesis
VRILAVNWLDIENPQAGGAEIHFFEIFRRLVTGGDDVTLICSGWKGAVSTATVDGVAVRRIGDRHSFALKGRGAVRRALNERSYDVVVEDINKLPLYLPSLTGLPTYVIIPHLFGGVAFQGAAWPIALIVWLAEQPIPRIYRRSAFHAISESTRDDLVARGVARDRIRVVHPGVDCDHFTPDPAMTRDPAPTFLYVGRLKRYKGIDIAIRALAVVRRTAPGAVLEIAGEGDDRARLERVTRRSGLSEAVRFLGYISEEEKLERLRLAWALIFPSAKEGWGISNVEAAACGTPTIASDSPGLRESLVDGETGLLAPHGDHEALARAMIRLATEPDLVDRLGAAGRQFATGFSWDAAARATREHIRETVRT